MMMKLVITKATLIIACLLLASEEAHGQGQPNETVNEIAVFMNSGFLSADQEPIENLVGSLIAELDETVFVNGKLSVAFYKDEMPRFTKELAAMLSITHCQQSKSLDAKARERNVIHLAITDIGCPRIQGPSSLSVPLANIENSIVQTVKDLRDMNTLTWPSLILLYDDSISPDNLINMKNVLNGDNAAVSAFDMGSDPSSSISAILSELPSRQLGNKFLVVTRQASVASIHQRVEEAGLLNINTQWMYLVTDTDNNSPLMSDEILNAQDGYNLAFLYNTSSADSTDCRDGLLCITEELVRMYVQSVHDVLSSEMELYLTISPEEWQLLRPQSSARAKQIMTNLRQYLRNEGRCGNCTGWAMKAAELVDITSGANVVDVGNWEPMQGLVLKDDLFPHVTGGLRGRVLTVASIDYPPWHSIKYDNVGNVIESYGLVFALLDEIGGRLNFSYQVVTPPQGDRYFGTLQGGNGYNGVLGMVERGEAQLSAAILVINEPRMKSVNFSLPISLEPYTLMFERPQELSRALLFIQPFTPMVWLCIFLSLLAIGPILWIFHNASYYYKVSENGPGGLAKLSNCVWYCYGSILQQGGTYLPEADSGRVLICFWWLFVIVTVTTYSGNLVAFLTFPRIEVALQGVEDLLSQREDGKSWGLVKNSAIETYLQESTQEKYLELLEFSKLYDNVDNDEIYQAVRTDEHVFIEWRSFLDLKMKREHKVSGRCDYSLAPENFFIERVALAFGKDMQWIDRFNQHIAKILEAGLMTRWKQIYWLPEDACSVLGGVGSGSTTVKVTDMQSSFYILGLGSVLGVLIFMIESALRKSKESREASVVKPFLA